jgi:hypothetical protein
LCIHLLCCCFLSKFQSLMISIVTGRVLFNAKNCCFALHFFLHCCQEELLLLLEEFF